MKKILSLTLTLFLSGCYLNVLPPDNSEAAPAPTPTNLQPIIIPGQTQVIIPTQPVNPAPAPIPATPILPGQSRWMPIHPAPAPIIPSKPAPAMIIPSKPAPAAIIPAAPAKKSDNEKEKNKKGLLH